MSEKRQIYIVYIIAISVVLLDIRPYICDKANLPNKSICNLQEEEENKKESSERNIDQEEKITNSSEIFGFNTSSLIHLYLHHNSKDHTNLAYPGPPPQV